MKFPAPRAWWRKLPQKTRVHLIASVLLVFAGTEIFILAPYFYEIAVMIDVFGSAFVLAAAAASVRMTLLRIRELFWLVVVRPVSWVLRLGEAACDAGINLPTIWLARLFRADALLARVILAGFATLGAARAAIGLLAA